MDDDSLDTFDDLFEPFGLEGRPDDAKRATGGHTVVPQALTGALLCAACGNPNDPENRHCDKCGARLVRSQMPVAPQPMLRTTAGARALIVLASVVLAVALLALVVNLFSGGGATTAESTTSTSTTIETVEISEVAPIRVNCTSELAAYPCTALLDGNADTSWNALDGGVGTELTFLFSPPVQITEMIIQNLQDECRFLRNARIRGIEVLVDDLTQTTIKELEDSQEPQRIVIGSLRTSSLTLRVTSAFPGQSCEGDEPFTELAAEDVFFYGRATPGEG
jgi:hypothetical protein